LTLKSIFFIDFDKKLHAGGIQFSACIQAMRKHPASKADAGKEFGGRVQGPFRFLSEAVVLHVEVLDDAVVLLDALLDEGGLFGRERLDLLLGVDEDVVLLL